MVDTTLSLGFQLLTPDRCVNKPLLSSSLTTSVELIALSLKSKLGKTSALLCFDSPDGLLAHISSSLNPFYLVLAGTNRRYGRPVEQERNHKDTSPSFDGFEGVLPAPNTQGFQDVRFIVGLRGYRQVCGAKAPPVVFWTIAEDLNGGNSQP